MKARYERKLTHAQTMALGFFMVIAVGTLLLMLPISNKDGNFCSLPDALVYSDKCYLCYWSCRS